MSDQRQGGGEPSMEEILTSIRQIISEDETSDSNPGGRDDGPDDGAGTVDDDDDVLELTDEVEAGEPAAGAGGHEADELYDGESETASAEDADMAGEESGQDEDDDEDDVPRSPQEALAAAAQAAMEDEEGEAPELDDEAPDSSMDADSLMDAEPSGSGDTAHDEDDAADVEPMALDAEEDDAAGETLEADADDEIDAMMAAPAADDAVDAEATPEPEADHPSPAPQQEAAVREDVTSEAVQEQATAALTQLAKAAHSRDFDDDRPKSDADRILENLVRDALRPQLQAWLDENLPSLVERIVREEVRRMTVRAEGLAEDERSGGDSA